MDFKGSENGQSLNTLIFLLFVIAKIIIYCRRDVAYLRSKVIAFSTRTLARKKKPKIATKE